MRRAVLSVVCGLGMLVLAAPEMFAGSGCAATPGAAVLQALGNEAGKAGAQGGFRVRDIVVDPLLHRAFVHVEQCGHPERPMVLLPFASAREVDPGAAAGVLSTVAVAKPAGPAVPSGSVVAVNMGDSHMRMTVSGRLLESASLGSVVEVQLASLDGSIPVGDQARRVRGMLTAADRVEVQP